MVAPRAGAWIEICQQHNNTYTVSLESASCFRGFSVMKEVRAVTDNQKRFCDEYLIDTNATRAYKAAYPNIKNDHSARTMASRLLTNVDVKKYIDDHLKEVHTDKIASAEEVLEFLTGVMRNRKEETRNRIKAGELMGKRHGLFKDTISVQGAIPIVIDGGDSLED